MSPARTATLASGVGLTVGLLAGVFVGAFLVDWGLALGTCVASLILAAGVVHLPEDDRLSLGLVVVLSLTVGFLVVSVPMTLDALAQAGRGQPELAAHIARASAEEARESLLPRWVVMAAAVPAGTAALLRRRRLLARSTPRADRR